MRLRGHHLLCIQHFQGYGYDPRFIRGMACIVEHLEKNPDEPVEVAAVADDICAACPHRTGGRCSADASGDSERAVAQRDSDTLRLLGVSPGAVLPYSQLLARLRAIPPESLLTSVCGGCQWIELCYASLKGALDLPHSK